MNKVLLIILSTLIMTGCATQTVFKQYEGAQKPDNELAIMHHNVEESVFVIRQVDNKERGNGMINRYELLPGEHSISSSFGNLGYRADTIKLYFYAEKGKEYEIIGEHNEDKEYWKIIITEKGSDKNISYRSPAFKKKS